MTGAGVCAGGVSDWDGSFSSRATSRVLSQLLDVEGIAKSSRILLFSVFVFSENKFDKNAFDS